MAASRRGAVKVNPVTGKIEKVEVEAGAGPDGVTKHRDGCLVVDDRYINAAKELGLGGEAGMYGHMKALVRMNAADIPVGSSIEREGAAAAAAAAAGGGASKPTLDAKHTGAVAAAMAREVKTAPKAVGAAKVHGFGGGGGPSFSDVHHHADAFQRRKGVVNTIGGAKAVTHHKEEPRLPPKGERKGAHILGFDTLDAHTAEGKARREAAAKREAAGSGIKATSVHVSGGGGRAMGAATLSTLGMKPAGGGGGGGGGPRTAPVAAAPAAASPPVARRTGTTHVLGGSDAANTGPAAAAAGAGGDREKRAAHFEKLLAEAAAKKKAASASL